MPEFTIEFETDSEDNITDSKFEYDQLCAGLESYTRPTNLNKTHEPIRDVIVGPLSKNPLEQKTYWLFAEIYPRHLREGESTSSTQKARDLAANIRKRGKSGDDCGHIIAASLGGKMVDFNLFPQNKWINQGLHGYRKHWRKTIEIAIQLWLTNTRRKNPRVEFQIRFFYNDPIYPDRPDSAKFLIKFKCDDEDEDEQDDKDIPKSVYSILAGVLTNLIKNESDSVNEPNYISCNSKEFEQFRALNSRQFEKFFRSFLRDLKTKKPKLIHPPISVVDLIPVFGSIRRLWYGIKDAKNGNRIGATVNILVGVGEGVYAAILFFMLKKVSSPKTLVRQTASKEGAKAVTKTAITSEAYHDTVDANNEDTTLPELADCVKIVTPEEIGKTMIKGAFVLAAYFLTSK